ncbi:MAG: hypothetical protein KGM16_04655 [Bacteroidota bacterium]|nr:hypothetical protein [Bacteroidota bacterium]
MKIIFTLLISLFVTNFVCAQTPMQTTVEYNGQKYPCYITEYNLPPDETKNAIVNKLKSEGYNADKSKGFLVYRNARLKDLNPDEPQDVLFKIERKSRKERNKSIVTMITAKAGLIPKDKVKGAKMVADIEPSANSVDFIKSFQSDINMASYNLAVSNQEDEVAKAEKKLKNLQDDQVNLEKKIKDYQDDLAKNKADQVKQTDEIAKQKSILDEKKAAKPLE